jgi:hypothetical protein
VWLLVAVDIFFREQSDLPDMKHELSDLDIKTAIDYLAKLVSILKMDTESTLVAKIQTLSTSNVLVILQMVTATHLVLHALKTSVGALAVTQVLVLQL